MAGITVTSPSNVIVEVSPGGGIAVSAVVSGVQIGGSSDHSSLTNLDTDDHLQYHNDARGDVRYYTKPQADSLLISKADTVHTHVEADITDLGAYPDATGQAATKIAQTDGANGWTFIDTPSGGGGTSDHGALTGLADDDHTQYHTDARGDARYYTQSQVDSSLTGKADVSHNHTLADVTDSGTAAALNVPAAGDAAVGEVVKGDDTRLTDARTPTAHTHTLADVTDSGTAAALNVPATGNAAAGEVVKGDDTRLTDSRTPTAHTHDDLYYTESETDSLLAGKAPLTGTGTSGTWPISITGSSASTTGNADTASRLATSRTISLAGDVTGSVAFDGSSDASITASVADNSHNHTLSNVTDAGTAAGLNVPAAGDAAVGEVVKGDDTRLTDARTPTAHNHTESEITDLGVYADATGQPATKIAQTDGANGWTFIDTPSGGGGVTDHGALTGLADDDHTQYHTDARGDARYYTQSQVDSSLSGKADSAHTHVEADITDLGAYPDSTGQSATQIPQTDGAGGWSFIPTPSGGASIATYKARTGAVLSVGEKAELSAVGATTNANEIQLAPLNLGHDYTIDQLQWEVVNFAGAGGLYDICLYGSTDGIPSGTPLWSLANLDGTVAGFFVDTPGAALNLSAGLYWIGFRRNAAASAIGMRCAHPSSLPVLGMGYALGVLACTWTGVSTQGAVFPTLNEAAWLAGTLVYNSQPLIGLRVG